jgi:hypothetical protein
MELLQYVYVVYFKYYFVSLSLSPTRARLLEGVGVEAISSLSTSSLSYNLYSLPFVILIQKMALDCVCVRTGTYMVRNCLYYSMYAIAELACPSFFSSSCASYRHVYIRGGRDEVVFAFFFSADCRRETEKRNMKLE